MLASPWEARSLLDHIQKQNVIQRKAFASTVLHFNAERSYVVIRLR
jgi:hypothetical protein